MEYGYYFYVILGWISGSILFGRLVPYVSERGRCGRSLRRR